MANIDWSKLTFSYTKTNTILTCMFRDGKWGEVESHTNDDITISSFAGALHYSIECFEGLKAFRGKTAESASSDLMKMQPGCRGRRNSLESKRRPQKCSLTCVSAV